MDLTELSIVEASDLLARREISAAELARAFLARIEALDPVLNCFITVTEELALEQARQADLALQNGRWLGPLHGIPVALKDLFETRGIPTTAGSKILADYVPQADCIAYQKLRGAGAVLLGKLNMHEFAFGVTNQNPHYGPVRNPWDPDRISGGSSGGSAAALAGGMCLGSLGTDTGGSIRIPASFCGVVGLKPTYGRVSLEGVIPLSPSMDHVGPMARTVEDVAVLFSAVVEEGFHFPDERGQRSFDTPIRRFAESLTLEPSDRAILNPASRDMTNDPSRRLAGYRLALAADPYYQEAEAEVKDAVLAAASAFEAVGARVEPASFPGGPEARDAKTTLLLHEAAAYHAADLKNRPQEFGADVLERLERGASIPSGEIAMARQVQADLRERFTRFFYGYDLLLTAATPVAASPIEGSNPVKVAPGLTRFTEPFNLTGLPAMSIPCGFTRDGLPIGLQLVGPPGSDWRLLEAGYAYEQHAGWFRRSPPWPS